MHKDVAIAQTYPCRYRGAETKRWGNALLLRNACYPFLVFFRRFFQMWSPEINNSSGKYTPLIDKCVRMFCYVDQWCDVWEIGLRGKRDKETDWDNRNHMWTQYEAALSDLQSGTHLSLLGHTDIQWWNNISMANKPWWLLVPAICCLNPSGCSGQTHTVFLMEMTERNVHTGLFPHCLP